MLRVRIYNPTSVKPRYCNNPTCFGYRMRVVIDQHNIDLRCPGCGLHSYTDRLNTNAIESPVFAAEITGGVALARTIKPANMDYIPH